MKKLAQILFVVVVLVGVATYFRMCAPLRIPPNHVLVTQAYLDSLDSIASLPPDTVFRIDSVFNHDTIYIVKEPPKPVDQGEYYAYTDSLKTDDVSVWVWDRIRKDGVIDSRRWAYRLHVPIYVTREVTIVRPVPKPYPVYMDKEQADDRVSYYVMVGLGTGVTAEGGVIYNQRFIGGLQGGKELALIKLGLTF